MEFVASLFFWQLMVSALFILALMSLIIGINSKEKSYVLYAVYTLFLLTYFILISPYALTWRDNLFTTRFHSVKWFIQIIYNCAYFLFFLYFLDVKRHLPKFYKFINKVVAIAFIIGSMFFVLAMLFNQAEAFDHFYIYVFVPILFVFALYTLFKATFLPGNLKYFFIVGGGAYIILAMAALFLPLAGRRFLDQDPFLLFYIGVFTEQLVFAIGLAYKTKQIHTEMLQKSLEHQQIKERQNKQLEDKLSQKEKENLRMLAEAEEARVARLKFKFEQEIHHLHLISLQSQMNPHFVFNALNSIKVFLIEDEKAKAIYYLNKFSKLIRIMLDSSRVEKINLEDELAILELYVSLENIRFEEQIELNITNSQNVNLKEIMVPPMILQAFVENAIWHGLVLVTGLKKIDLEIEKIEDTVRLMLRDNGIGREKSQQNVNRKSYKKDAMGLKINQERLEHFNKKYGCHYFFKINDLYDELQNPSGTEVELVFCFKSASE